MGDENRKLFQVVATQIYRRNYISSIKNKGDVFIIEHEQGTYYLEFLKREAWYLWKPNYFIEFGKSCWSYESSHLDNLFTMEEGNMHG